jgi:hypothetical protein
MKELAAKGLETFTDKDAKADAEDELKENE